MDIKEEEKKIFLREDDVKKVYFTMGKFNPPTIGHKKMIDFLKEYADGNEVRVYTTHRQGPTQPLSYDSKLKWLRKAFGPVVKASAAINPFEVLFELYDEGYTDVVFIGGDDRLSKLVNYFKADNGKQLEDGRYYKFNSIGPSDEEAEWISSKLRRVDGDGVEGVSSSKLRQFVKDGNKEAFIENVPYDPEDAEELYNEVKSGMGLNEELIVEGKSSDLGIIHKEIENELSQYKDVLRIGGFSPQRHPKEITRFSLNDDYDISDVLKYVVGLLKGLEVNGKTIKSSSIDLKDFKIHPGSSHQDPSYRVDIKYDDGTKDDYYIAVTNSKIQKEFVPNKILNDISGNINYLEVGDRINYNNKDVEKILKTLLKETTDKSKIKYSSNLRDNLDYLRGEPDSRNHGSVVITADTPETSKLLNKFKNSNPELYNKLINSIDVDFAEVAGATLLSAAINKVSKKNLTIYFPSASNEPIIDYKIFEGNGNKPLEIKVSAKTGSGARPSGGGLMSSIDKTTEKRFKPAREFSKWIQENHYNRSKNNAGTNGYKNLADETYRLLTGNVNSSWEDMLEKTSIGKIPNKENICKLYLRKKDQKTILKLADECNRAISSLNGSLIDTKRFNKPHNNTYWTNSSYAIMSKLFASILNYNNGDESSPKYLINLINQAFSSSYGVFIQNYCIPNLKSGLLKGNIKFDAVFASMTGSKLPDGSKAPSYQFLQNTAQEGEDGNMTNQKLAIVLKH